MYKKLITLTVLSLFLVAAYHGATSMTSQSQVSIDIPDAINPVDPTKIPIGDGNLSTTNAKVGSIFACRPGVPGGPGAQQIGPWVNTTAKTWDSTRKIRVLGNVNWPHAVFNISISGDRRVIAGNNLPINHTTGVFPVSASDPAYFYDRNPNSIRAQTINLSLPANPTVANTVSCAFNGAIGILNDGVVLYNAVDLPGRDAPVHEVLDGPCDGHPQIQGEYHHHNIPSCMIAQASGASTSTLVGYAYDGFGIYVERDKNGNLLTNANLDECHGRVGKVMWDGQLVEMYHYVATLEYPYAIGCFKGTPVNVRPGR
jgi:hypothetical protein